MNYQIQDGKVFCDTAVVYGRSEQLPLYALAAAENTLVVEGASDPAAELRLEVPYHVPGEWVRAAEKKFRSLCYQRHILAEGVQIRKNPLIQTPCAMVTVQGTAKGKDRSGSQKAAEGQEILLAGRIGMEGMLRAVEEGREELEHRFTAAFLQQIHGYEQQLFLKKEHGNTIVEKAKWARQVTDGGILAALWNLALDLGTGIELDIKAFPVLQETIEVCEYYRLNPYQLASAGCVLMTAEDGGELVRDLEKEGLSCTVIGHVTDGRDKIIRNGEDLRYIDRPAPDEIWKLLEITKKDGR